MLRKDSIIYGFVLGLIFPFLCYMGYLIVVHGIYSPFKGYLYLSEFGIFANLVKLFVLINLPLFFLFLNMNKMETVKGIIMVTLVFAFYVLYQSFFG